MTRVTAAPIDQGPVEQVEPAPPLTFRESLGAIAYLGFGYVYVHLTALWVWNVIHHTMASTWTDFITAGTALTADVGWVIPTAVGSIFAAYVALFGESFARRRFAQRTKDMAVLSALAVASVLLGYATTTCIAILAGAENAARAFPIVGFTLLTVLLAAGAGTAFWGNPAGQVRTAVQEEADLRVMRLRLESPSGKLGPRVAAATAWTVLPATLFGCIYAFTGTGPVPTILLTVSALVITALTVWGLFFYVRSRAFSPRRYLRVLNAFALAVTVASVVLSVGAIWPLLGPFGQVTLVTLIVLIGCSAFVSAGRWLTIRALAQASAYNRLSLRIPKARVNTRSARARLATESTSG